MLTQEQALSKLRKFCPNCGKFYATVRDKIKVCPECKRELDNEILTRVDFPIGKEIDLIVEQYNGYILGKFHMGIEWRTGKFTNPVITVYLNLNELKKKPEVIVKMLEELGAVRVCL